MIERFARRALGGRRGGIRERRREASVEREPARSEASRRPTAHRGVYGCGRDRVNRAGRAGAPLGADAVPAGRPEPGGTPRPTPTRPSTATFLGDARFVWGPEGLDEADAGLLGPVDGPDGAGGRLRSGPVRALAARPRAPGRSRVDLSVAPAAARGALDDETGPRVPRRPGRRGRAAVRGRRRSTWRARRTARCRSSPTARGLHRRGGPGAAARRPLGVLGAPTRCAGRFPDDPGPAGLGRDGSYFDRSAVRRDRRRAAGDLRRAPPHPRRPGPGARRPPGSCCWTWSSRSGRPGNDQVWGGWSPLRGALLPGTAVFVAPGGSAARWPAAGSRRASPAAGRGLMPAEREEQPEDEQHQPEDQATIGQRS